MAKMNATVQAAVSAAAAANSAAKTLNPGKRTVLTVKDQAEIIGRLGSTLSIAHSALRFVDRTDGLPPEVADATRQAANLVYQTYTQVNGVRGRVHSDVATVASRYPRSAEHTPAGLTATRSLGDTLDRVHDLDRAVYANHLATATREDLTELARQLALLAYGLTVACRNDGARVNATYAEVQWSRRAGTVQAALVEAARLLAIVQRVLTNLYGALARSPAAAPERLSA